MTCPDCQKPFEPNRLGPRRSRCSPCAKARSIRASNHGGNPDWKPTVEYVCEDCHGTFPRPGTKGFLPKRCPGCLDKHSLAQKRANPGVWRKYQYKTKFGITIEQYDLMLATQGGHCAICPATSCTDGRRLHVDHDHQTGVVRQLLCDLCNKVLGMMKDEPDRLRRAADYLEHHKKKVSTQCA